MSLGYVKTVDRLSEEKGTYHVVLGGEFSYQVGDTVAIKPRHHRELVDQTLKALKASGSEIVTIKKTGETTSLREFIACKANISSVSRKLIAQLPNYSGLEKETLKILSQEKELWDLLQDGGYPNMSLQEICDYLTPLLPRFYSIASSQSAHPNEMHLTVVCPKYTTGGYERLGVCSHYLCHEAEKVIMEVHPHNGFTLPEKERSIIMVGPGTGVAPFVGFMQERETVNATGDHWLFFGERTRQNEYYYGHYWDRLAAEKKLKLDLAFSRDQQHKIYVQHRMEENADELSRWVKDGAVIYVCGDAKRMAKDVEVTLQNILGKERVKQLRADKRYLRDVY